MRPTRSSLLDLAAKSCGGAGVLPRRQKARFLPASLVDLAAKSCGGAGVLPRRQKAWFLPASLPVVFLVLGTTLVAGCDKISDELGMGQKGPVDDGAPDDRQLQKIAYMSSENSGVKGRKLYIHLAEAKTCGDLELAMRWNRPPNVEGGPFHKKMTYLTEGFPAGLEKQTEVFIAARIERGETLAGGGAAWLLKTKDGNRAQAVEGANFWEKQEQDSQTGQQVAIVKPTKPGRAFCGQGVYQGATAKDPEQGSNMPLVSMLFSMDRDK
jgi:hypothetical protein